MVWYGMYGMVCMYGMVSMHKSIEGEFTPKLDDGPGPLQYSLFRLFSLFSLCSNGSVRLPVVLVVMVVSGCCSIS